MDVGFVCFEKEQMLKRGQSSITIVLKFFEKEQLTTLGLSERSWLIRHSCVYHLVHFEQVVIYIP